MCATAAFQHPAHTVAAVVVGIDHLAADLHVPGDRTAPADGDCDLGRGMHHHAVRFDAAWDADVAVGGVGHQDGQFAGLPATDEGVVVGGLDAFLEVGQFG